MSAPISAFETQDEDIVPGDIILLRAGDVIPGDCRVLEGRDLFVDDAAEIFAFTPLPLSSLIVMGIIVVVYTVAAELAKKAFHSRVDA